MVFSLMELIGAVARLNSATDVFLQKFDTLRSIRNIKLIES